MPPPTPATRGSEHSCRHPPPSSTPNLQPPLERRLQGGSRRQNASAVRPKGQDFRLEQEGGRGGQIWKLDPPSRGERHRSAAGVEVDAKSTRGFPRSKTPPPHPRPDLTGQPPNQERRPLRGEGAERKKAARRSSKASPPSRHPRGRKGRPAPARAIHRRDRRRHLHPGPPPWLPEPLTAA